MSSALRGYLGDLLRLLGSNVATRALGLAALAFYTRLLSPAELAALPAFLILGSFTNVPLNMGLFASMVREVPPLLGTAPDQARGLLRRAVLITSGGVLVVSSVYWIAAESIGALFLEGGYEALVRTMVVGCVLRGIDEVVTWVMRATRAFSHLASKKILSEVAQPLASLALIPLLGVSGLIWGQSIGLLLAVVYGAWTSRSHLLGPAKPPPMRPLLRRSRAYYAEGWVFFFAQQGDQAVVAAALSPPALAGYYVARRLFDALSLVLYSFEEVMGPTLASARSNPTALDESRRLLVFGVTAFSVPTAALAAALAPTYLALVGGGEYDKLAWATALISAGILPLGLMTISWQLSLILGLPGDRLRVSLSFTSLMLVASIIAAPFGVTAIAGARFVALALAAILGLALVRNVGYWPRRRDLAVLIAASAVLVAPIIVAQVGSGRLWTVLGATLLGVALAIGVLAWLLEGGFRRAVFAFARPNQRDARRG